MKNAGRLAVVLGVTLPASYIFWLVFVGTFSLHELLIGIIATIFTAVGMAAVTLNYPVPFSPTLADLFSCWRLPWYLLSGTWKVLAVAAKDLLGVQRAKSLFRVVRYEPDTKKSPRRSARRVLAVVYTTVTPTSIVLGVNANQGKLLVHQINPGSVSKMMEQLGAEA